MISRRKLSISALAAAGSFFDLTRAAVAPFYLNCGANTDTSPPSGYAGCTGLDLPSLVSLVTGSGTVQLCTFPALPLCSLGDCVTRCNNDNNCVFFTFIASTCTTYTVGPSGGTLNLAGALGGFATLEVKRTYLLFASSSSKLASSTTVSRLASSAVQAPTFSSPLSPVASIASSSISSVASASSSSSAVAPFYLNCGVNTDASPPSGYAGCTGVDPSSIVSLVTGSGSIQLCTLPGLPICSLGDCVTRCDNDNNCVFFTFIASTCTTFTVGPSAGGTLNAAGALSGSATLEVKQQYLLFMSSSSRLASSTLIPQIATSASGPSSVSSSISSVASASSSSSAVAPFYLNCGVNTDASPPSGYSGCTGIDPSSIVSLVTGSGTIQLCGFPPLPLCSLVDCATRCNNDNNCVFFTFLASTCTTFTVGPSASGTLDVAGALGGVANLEVKQQYLLFMLSSSRLASSTTAPQITVSASGPSSVSSSISSVASASSSSSAVAPFYLNCGVNTDTSPPSGYAGCTGVDPSSIISLITGSGSIQLCTTFPALPICTLNDCVTKCNNDNSCVFFTFVASTCTTFTVGPSAGGTLDVAGALGGVANLEVKQQYLLFALSSGITSSTAIPQNVVSSSGLSTVSSSSFPIIPIPSLSSSFIPSQVLQSLPVSSSILLSSTAAITPGLLSSTASAILGSSSSVLGSSTPALSSVSQSITSSNGAGQVISSSTSSSSLTSISSAISTFSSLPQISQFSNGGSQTASFISIPSPILLQSSVNSPTSIISSTSTLQATLSSFLALSTISLSDSTSIVPGVSNFGFSVVISIGPNGGQTSSSALASSYLSPIPSIASISDASITIVSTSSPSLAAGSISSLSTPPSMLSASTSVSPVSNVLPTMPSSVSGSPVSNPPSVISGQVSVSSLSSLLSTISDSASGISLASQFSAINPSNISPSSSLLSTLSISNTIFGSSQTGLAIVSSPTVSSPFQTSTSISTTSTLSTSTSVLSSGGSISAATISSAQSSDSTSDNVFNIAGLTTSNTSFQASTSISTISTPIGSISAPNTSASASFSGGSISATRINSAQSSDPSSDNYFNIAGLTSSNTGFRASSNSVQSLPSLAMSIRSSSTLNSATIGATTQQSSKGPGVTSSIVTGISKSASISGKLTSPSGSISVDSSLSDTSSENNFNIAGVTASGSGLLASSGSVQSTSNIIVSSRSSPTLGIAANSAVSQQSSRGLGILSSTATSSGLPSSGGGIATTSIVVPASQATSIILRISSATNSVNTPALVVSLAASVQASAALGGSVPANSGTASSIFPTCPNDATKLDTTASAAKFRILCPGINIKGRRFRRSRLPLSKRQTAFQANQFDTCMNACAVVTKCQSAIYVPATGFCSLYTCAVYPTEGQWGGFIYSDGTGALVSPRPCPSNTVTSVDPNNSSNSAAYDFKGLKVSVFCSEGTCGVDNGVCTTSDCGTIFTVASDSPESGNESDNSGSPGSSSAGSIGNTGSSGNTGNSGNTGSTGTTTNTENAGNTGNTGSVVKSGKVGSNGSIGGTDTDTLNSSGNLGNGKDGFSSLGTSSKGTSEMVPDASNLQPGLSGAPSSIASALASLGGGSRSSSPGTNNAGAENSPLVKGLGVGSIPNDPYQANDTPLGSLASSSAGSGTDPGYSSSGTGISASNGFDIAASGNPGASDNSGDASLEPNSGSSGLDFDSTGKTTGVFGSGTASATDLNTLSAGSGISTGFGNGIQADGISSGSGADSGRSTEPVGGFSLQSVSDTVEPADIENSSLGSLTADSSSLKKASGLQSGVTAEDSSQTSSNNAVGGSGLMAGSDAGAYNSTKTTTDTSLCTGSPKQLLHRGIPPSKQKFQRIKTLISLPALIIPFHRNNRRETIAQPCGSESASGAKTQSDKQTDSTQSGVSESTGFRASVVDSSTGESIPADGSFGSNSQDSSSTGLNGTQGSNAESSPNISGTIASPTEGGSNSSDSNGKPITVSVSGSCKLSNGWMFMAWSAMSALLLWI